MFRIANSNLALKITGTLKAIVVVSGLFPFFGPDPGFRDPDFGIPLGIGFLH